jgi:Kef-type K+ transport system membrane component KefB
VQVVAESRSDETFVALCLLTVTGASLLTQKLGFSDTAGAFAAGVLLSETNFRSQVGSTCTSASVVVRTA